MTNPIDPGLFYSGSVLSVLIFVLDLYAVIQVLQSNKPFSAKILWSLLIFLCPIVGLIIYLYVALLLFSLFEFLSTTADINIYTTLRHKTPLASSTTDNAVVSATSVSRKLGSVPHMANEGKEEKVEDGGGESCPTMLTRNF